MNLKEWIAQLEAAEEPEPLQRDLVRGLREANPEGDFHISHSDPLAVRDYVSYRLKVLWIDLEFWMLVGRKADPIELQTWIQTKYDLLLPPLKFSIYSEMARDRAARNQLFHLLRSKPSTFIGAAITKDAQDAIAELESRGAKTLLLGYIGRSAVSRRSWLRWMQLSDTTLKEIEAAIFKLNNDIKWCLENPTDRKPKTILFPRRGQPTPREHVEQIEAMVEIVKIIPTATNDKIAKRYAEQAKLPNLDDKQQHTLRIQVGYAKRLVELREGIRVKHHLDEKGYGKKPRKK